MGEINILIADDHTVLREGARQIPEQESDLVVVAQADDTRSARHGS